MMGRLKRDQGQFFYSFRLDEAVPGDHPYARLPAFSTYRGCTWSWRRSIPTLVALD
jgi:hypothetical protein